MTMLSLPYIFTICQLAQDCPLNHSISPDFTKNWNLVRD